VGNNAATVLTSAIQSIRSSERGALAGTVSIVMLLIGAASFVSGKTTIAYYLGPSVARSKAAMCGHFKTGHRTNVRDRVFYSFIRN
jgi:hypothetical protein